MGGEGSVPVVGVGIEEGGGAGEEAQALDMVGGKGGEITLGPAAMFGGVGGTQVVEAHGEAAGFAEGSLDLQEGNVAQG